MELFPKIKNFAAKIGQKTGEIAFWTVILLTITLAFGLGWLIGSRSVMRPPITVNCPPHLYETPAR